MGALRYIAMAKAASALLQAAARKWFQNTQRSRNITHNVSLLVPSESAAASASFIGTLIAKVTAMLPAR